MNYYPFHLGDYAAHTGHLEPLEDLAYRRMLDLYYLRETPLSTDVGEVCRLIRMRQNEAEVLTVLREFFTLADDGWRHSRCDEELERMQDKQAKARASAAASVNARRRNAQQTQSESTANAERTLNERSTNAELPTPTPTPTPINKNNRRESRSPSASELLANEGVTEQTAKDFLKIRAAKKSPLTETALQGIKREAEKAGWPLENALRECVIRGWQGFKAEWVGNQNIARPNGKPSYDDGRKREYGEGGLI